MLYAAALSFPNIDPVAIEIGPLAIKWYGLSYLAGLLLGWLYIRQLIKNRALWGNNTPPIELTRIDDLLIYMTLGVILGGRLGFVLLYEPGYYIANLGDILAVWKGGMSFHGALIGCGVAIILFAWRFRAQAASVMDLCAAAVPLGLFFGRLANFINGELFGRVTTVSWGMVFPEARYMYPGIEPAPRHPSQLYEAALEGLLLFLVLRFTTHWKLGLHRPGLVTGIFLIGYGCARSFAEIFREPHFAHALNIPPFTVGQIYSIPMILLGLYLIFVYRPASSGTVQQTNNGSTG